MDFALFRAVTLGEMEFFDASIDVPIAPNIHRILPFKCLQSIAHVLVNILKLANVPYSYRRLWKE